MMIQRALVMALCALGVGCRGAKTANNGYVPEPPPAPEALVIPKDDEAKLMPLIEGSVWTYDIENTLLVTGRPSETSKGVLTYRVVKVTRDGTDSKALLELSQDGQVLDRQDWVFRPTGIYQASGGPKRIPYDPPQPVALFPLEKATTFRWKGTGTGPDGSVGRLTTKSRVLPSQRVDSGQGTYNALPIETTTEFNTRIKGKSTSVTYFKPGIGILRYRQEIDLGDRAAVATMRLRSYVVKPK